MREAKTEKRTETERRGDIDNQLRVGGEGGRDIDGQRHR